MPKPKSIKTTKVLFGAGFYEWPYELSPGQIKKIKDLYKKYNDKARRYGKKHGLSLGLICYKRPNVPNMPIVVCNLQCKPLMGGCTDFRMGFHFCNTLKCPYVEECFTKGKKFRLKKCKKMNLYEERKKVKEEYEHFFLLHRIARGFKLNPLQTLRFLKKKKENGKIQTRKNKGEVKRTGNRKKKKHKKSLKVKKTD